MFSWDSDVDYIDLINVLIDNGIILASSDTVLGLFAQLSEKSKLQLDFIKVRNCKPYIILISSQEKLPLFVDQKIDDVIQKIMKTYWPGPLTIIFKAKATLPHWLKGVDGTVAIRIPHHIGLQKILAHVDGLFTTSANISEEPLPVSYDTINPVILDQVQAVCCDVSKIYDGPASTIIDVSSGSIKIVRQGIVVIDSI